MVSSPVPFRAQIPEDSVLETTDGRFWRRKIQVKTWFLHVRPSLAKPTPRRRLSGVQHTAGASCLCAPRGRGQDAASVHAGRLESRAQPASPRPTPALPALCFCSGSLGCGPLGALQSSSFSWGAGACQRGPTCREGLRVTLALDWGHFVMNLHVDHVVPVEKEREVSVSCKSRRKARSPLLFVVSPVLRGCGSGRPPAAPLAPQPPCCAVLAWGPDAGPAWPACWGRVSKCSSAARAPGAVRAYACAHTCVLSVPCPAAPGCWPLWVTCRVGIPSPDTCVTSIFPSGH